MIYVISLRTIYVNIGVNRMLYHIHYGQELKAIRPSAPMLAPGPVGGAFTSRVPGSQVLKREVQAVMKLSSSKASLCSAIYIYVAIEYSVSYIIYIIYIYTL